MKILVTKASSDYWYRIRVINTMEDFQIADAIYHYQKIREELS